MWKKTFADGSEVTYGYDADGNRTWESGPSGTRHFTFDSQSRLACVGVTAGGCDVLAVAYDPEGRRVRDVSTEGGVTTERLYPDRRFTAYHRSGSDGQWRYADFHIVAFGEEIARKRVDPVALRTAGGLAWPRGGPAPPPPLVLLVVSGLGFGALGLLGVRRAAALDLPARPLRAGLAGGLATVLVLPPLPAVSGGGGTVVARRWLVSDHLGTASVMVASDGSLVREAMHAPFGGVVGESAPVPEDSAQVFAGHRWEGESGLYYMQARWYDPATGAFLSVDPVVADAADPQSYNAYAYARNNPVRYVDPTGMCAAALFGGACVWQQQVNGQTYTVTATAIPSIDLGSLPGQGAVTNASGPSFGPGGLTSPLSGGLGLGGSGAPQGILGAEPVQLSQSGVVVDSTAEAVDHYFTGKGQPATLGPETQDAIKNSPDQQAREERIRTGQTSNIYRGNYGVDVTRQKYFVGDTPVHYRTACGGGSCTTTFTSKGDGFWDVAFGDFDGPGPRGEVPGGTPYPFRPFSWQVTFPDPRARP